MNNQLKHKMFDKNCVIMFAFLILFFAVDALKIHAEMKLRAEFEADFMQHSEDETTSSEEIPQTAAMDNERIDKQSFIKTIASFTSVVLLIFILVFWFKAGLAAKFISIALMLIYSAGMHLIDYEYLVQLSKFGKDVQVAKYLIVRLFPPVLFILLFIATILYKPIPKA